MPPRSGARGTGPGSSAASRTVLAEIEEISKATLQSISIATMLKLIQRQQRR